MLVEEVRNQPLGSHTAAAAEGSLAGAVDLEVFGFLDILTFNQLDRTGASTLNQSTPNNDQNKTLKY